MNILLAIAFIFNCHGPDAKQLLDSARKARNTQPAIAINISMYALEISGKSGDSVLMAEAYRLLGLLHSDLGDNREAMVHYRKSIDISEAINYGEGIRKAYNNLGVIQLEMGKYQESLNSHYKSLRMKEEANDSLGISYSLSNLGLLHHKFKDYQNAEKFFLKSIRIRERFERTDLLAKGYNRLADLYFEMNLDDKALAFWNKSYQINQEIMNPEMLSENYLGFARIRLKRKDFVNARQMVLKSISLARKGGFKDELANSYNLIAKILLEKGNLNQALLYADSCRSLCINIFDKHLEWSNATLLANIHLAKQDFEKAHYFLTQAIASKEEEYSLVVANNVYNANLRILENEQETKLLVKDIEIKRREKAIIILIIASGLLTAFTIFVIILYRYVSGLNRSLKREKEKLKKKRDELSIYARNLKSLVESKTESIYHKNMQLAGYAFLNAHKMRSPITTLLGLVQLTEGNKQMEDEILLREIKKNVIRLDRISKHINQILAEEMDLINDDKMKKYFANFKESIENYNENDPDTLK